MKHLFITFHVFFFLFLLMGVSLNLLSREIPYATGTWDAALLGNHRAVVQVSEPVDAAAVHISWRRRDDDPHKKDIIVLDAETGKRVLNVYLVEINREFGELVFQPQTIPGTYYIYYMPHTSTGSRHYPTVRYLEPEPTAATEWLQKHRLTSAASAQEKWKRLEQAKVFEIQSIDAFNSFYPMEIIAARREVENLLSKHPGKSYLLFPEDRTHPIRMTADLPYKWIKTGVQTLFKGEAARGEFYTFQIGLYAVKTSIKDIAVRFTDLESKDSKAAIPASAIRCFNLGGIDWTGKPFKKQCPVKKGEIQPLWFGLQVPGDLLPGQYEGEVAVAPYGMEVQTVKLRLKVNKEVLEDAGDSEPWRHSRLRWLDSRAASDEKIVPPFTNMRIGRRDEGTLIACLGRILTIDKTGFPISIRSLFAPEVTHIQEGSGREILVSPVTLIVEDSNHTVLSWETNEFTITRRSPGAVGWKAQHTAASGVLFMDLKGQMEMDGFIQFKIALRASRPFKVSDIRLEIPIVKAVARYMMGLGLKGGFRPAGYKWKWNVKKNQDSAWLGDVNAGLQYSLRGANYSRPLNTNFYQLKPLNMPVSWYNDGKGGTDIFEKGTDTVLVNAYSGERTLKAGEELHFDFNLLITPFKPLDTAGQWNHRFYHRFKPLKEIAATGANTVNVHHATGINPFINYPFLRPGEMKAYIDEAHRMGMKVKIYYTVRELSNFAPELFALRSLGDEILSYGPGGGFAWLQEHLGGNYIAGWLVPKYKDAAVINSGVSRWHNYYLEGLDWLVKHIGIDGLYIDDVAFDRTVMKRVRKILDRGRKGALIDLHSANQFNPRDGFANSANLYLEHFPYINRLWFGEYFDYNSPPEFWLVEVSGIPFGLMGEMLQDGGNPWRGMIYGMTNRLPWAGDPTPIWKAWDDFGIKESRMIGCWSPHCPVKTDHKDILATAYVKKGEKTMAAIASWAKEDVKCKISIDWKFLGLDAKKARLTAPAVKDFQPAAVFNPHAAIPIPQGKGWLLIIDNI
jgi:hypothetical protein